ncbi:MAG: hydroxyethylthiazole kinase [Candidatus Atribacteria bacterium]|nr:hydroxyethylthiazole kinase [Candidatus Atribacteria bacterium]
MNIDCVRLLRTIKEVRPLIHHLTNFVVANDNANAMLSIGASPVLASAPEEVEEMTAQSDALVLNLGTPSTETARSFLLAGRAANRKGIPVVFDPVGVGATHFRTDIAHSILTEVNIAILRGNPGEIASLLGMVGKVRGVESGRVEIETGELAFRAAQAFHTVTAITGRVDFVSDGEKVVSIHNGHMLLTTITGTGCMATSLCGAFASVEKDGLVAASSALGFLGSCAEIAAQNAGGPGSFRGSLFDVMYTITEEALVSLLRIEVEK